jgi:hypothetical protein
MFIYLLLPSCRAFLESRFFRCRATHRTQADEADADASDINGCVGLAGDANLPCSKPSRRTELASFMQNPQVKVGVMPLGFLSVPSIPLTYAASG